MHARGGREQEADRAAYSCDRAAAVSVQRGESLFASESSKDTSGFKASRLKASRLEGCQVLSGKVKVLSSKDKNQRILSLATDATAHPTLRRQL
jgi:hypothetical protein